jgi:hypothetical protein
MGALIRKIPFKAEIAFMPRGRVGRDDRNEERAVLDLAPDLLIPRVPAPQLALVEKHFDSGSAECRANLLGSLRILRGVAQKYRVRGLSHRRGHPWQALGGLLLAPVCGSLAQVLKTRRIDPMPARNWRVLPP